MNSHRRSAPAGCEDLRQREGVRARFLRPAQITPYALFFPAAFFIVSLNLVSAAAGLYLSFLDWNYLRAAERFKFVGLKHFGELVSDPLFYVALKNTIVWSVAVVPGGFLVGLFLALLLNELTFGKAFFRIAILLPWATPLVVVAVLARFALAPGLGPVDDLLFRLGFVEMKYMNWLGEQAYAMPIVMGVQVWRWAPFFALTLLAGFQSISPEVYDAAEIDGAGTLARFRYITVPLLRPVIGVVVLQGLIWSFHNFTLVLVMTGGGPVNATELLTIYLWRIGFTVGQVGKAAATGTLLLVMILAIGVVWVNRVISRGETR